MPRTVAAALTGRTGNGSGPGCVGRPTAAGVNLWKNRINYYQITLSLNLSQKTASFSMNYRQKYVSVYDSIKQEA